MQDHSEAEETPLQPVQPSTPEANPDGPSVCAPGVAPRQQWQSLLGPGFSSAFEYAAVGMALVDLEGRCLAANRALCNIVGYSEEELLGQHLRAVTHPDDLAENMALGRRLISGEIPSFTLEKRYIHKDGHIIYVLLSTSMLYGADGKPQYVISQVQDISERKRIEQQLRDSEARYRSLVEASPDAIGAVDIPGRFVFVNRQFASMLGYDAPEDMLGVSIYTHVAPEDHKMLMADGTRVLLTGVLRNIEYTFLTRSGDRIPVEGSYSVIYDAQGQPSLLIGTIRDITARKRAEVAEHEQRALSEALCDTAAALSSTLDFDVVLQRLLDNAGNVVPHDAANIMLVDSRRNEAYIARAHGYAELGLDEWVRSLRFPLIAESDLRRMMEDGQPVLVSDTHYDPKWIPHPESKWLRSYVAAPIRIKGQTIGFLNFDSGTPGFFTPTHMRRVQAFADQAALAIENARLFKAARQNVTRLTMLYQSGVALAKADSMEALYREALHCARALTDASVATLSRYDGDEHLVFVAASGMSQDVVGSQIALGKGVNGRAAQLRQPVQQHSYGDWEGRQAIFHQIGIASVVGLPLLWQGQLVGTLSVADQREHEFDDEDMHMLSLLATLVAASLEQRRAVSEAQTHAAEANALSSRLSHAQEEERVRIAERLHDSIGYRLSTLQKNIEYAQAVLGHDHPVAGRLAASLSVLHETHHQTRSLAMDLNSKVLADLGLSPAARQYIERLAASTGISIRVHVTGRVRRLSADVERVAFRGLQETVNNALRHANAAEINAQLHFGPRSLRITVQDDGCGFDASDIERRIIETGNSNGTALGLPESRRQVEALQGGFIIESMPGKGTLVVLTLPIRTAVPDVAKARVLLVDDHEMTRQGLRFALAQSEDFTCSGEASDGLAAVQQVELIHPDLVVMDIQLPYLSGIEAARQISKRFPHVGIIMYSYHDDEVYLEQALRAGARGYVLKSDESRQVIAALRAVHAGDMCVSPALVDKWARLQDRPSADDPLEVLTMREREVYELIVAGGTNRIISRRLGISVRTVEVHRKNIMGKLGLKNLAQLIQFAHLYGKHEGKWKAVSGNT